MNEWFALLQQLPPSAQNSLHLLAIILLSGLMALLLNKVLIPLLYALLSRSKRHWTNLLLPRSVQRQIALFFTAIFSYFLTDQIFPLHPTWLAVVHPLLQLALLLTFVRVLFSVIALLERLMLRFPFSANLPVKALFQVAKILLAILTIIISISILSNQSPALVISGFGAMAAVLMLVFKDPILGFVAGIQLSANKMLSVGDWLEMPKYNADGDVIEISLTTVKVSNWDKTITTIPTYALISDSFKNWRGMVESGGRRIKRTVVVDISTVHFLSTEEIERLRQLRLITSYIDDKLQEIAEHNKKLGLAPDTTPSNGRHLTNLGTFRAYISRYIESLPTIHKGLTQMVRQLAPTAEGIPLEIYCFVNDTRWVFYENVQSDLFDHILAVAGEFNLKIYQSPSGEDIQKAASQLLK